MDERSPINWVRQIQVPVYLSSSWQDEQTGGDFASMLDRIPKRDDVKIVVQNGVHSSTLDPEVIWNWLAFLDLYVAKRVPDPSRLAIIAPVIYDTILGGGHPTPPLPGDRFEVITDYAEAKTLFELDPHIRVLMENGAGSDTPGLPAPTFELGFKQWPPTEVHPTTWYFASSGMLQRDRPRGTGQGTDSYRPDPSVRPVQTLPGQGQDDSWAVLPPYDWEPIADGTGLAYKTLPLTEDVTIAGPSSVDLWLRSTAKDTDIQVTLSEIRPDDGKEYYVQNGWLRASHRKLDRKTSTKLEPRPTHLEADASDLPSGKFVKVRVGIFSVAHVFRAGSQIRIGIMAPGGDRTRWAFDTPATNGAIENTIAHTVAQPSRLVLPVVPGVQAPEARPPCPSLRGQPCRTYVTASNGG
jgi:predicted acyl esterase